MRSACRSFFALLALFAEGVVIPNSSLQGRHALGNAGKHYHDRRHYLKHKTNSSLDTNSHYFLNTSYEGFRAAVLGNAEGRSVNSKVVGIVVLAFSLVLLCGFIAFDFPAQAHLRRHGAFESAPATLETNIPGAAYNRALVPGGYQFYPPTCVEKISVEHQFDPPTSDRKYGAGCDFFYSTSDQKPGTDDQSRSPTSGQSRGIVNQSSPPTLTSGQTHGIDNQLPPPTSGQNNCDNTKPKVTEETGASVLRDLDPSRVRIAIGYDSLPAFRGRKPVDNQSALVHAAANPGTVPPENVGKPKPLCPELIGTGECWYAVGFSGPDSIRSPVPIYGRDGKLTLTADIQQICMAEAGSVKLSMGDAKGAFWAGISTSTDRLIIGDRHRRPYGEVIKVDSLAYKLVCDGSEVMRLTFDHAFGKVALVNPHDGKPLAFASNLANTNTLPNLEDPMGFEVVAGMDPVVAVLCVLGKIALFPSSMAQKQHALEGRDAPDSPNMD